MVWNTGTILRSCRHSYHSQADSPQPTPSSARFISPDGGGSTLHLVARVWHTAPAITTQRRQVGEVQDSMPGRWRRHVSTNAVGADCPFDPHVTPVPARTSSHRHCPRWDLLREDWHVLKRWGGMRSARPPAVRFVEPRRCPLFSGPLGHPAHRVRQGTTHRHGAGLPPAWRPPCSPCQASVWSPGHTLFDTCIDDRRRQLMTDLQW